jgi:hypothetical protein
MYTALSRGQRLSDVCFDWTSVAGRVFVDKPILTGPTVLRLGAPPARGDALNRFSETKVYHILHGLDVKYVGQTVQSLEERWSGHCSATTDKAMMKIQAYIKKHPECRISFVQATPCASLKEAVCIETKFMRMAAAGHKLLNVAQTGKARAPRTTNIQSNIFRGPEKRSRYVEDPKRFRMSKLDPDTGRYLVAKEFCFGSRIPKQTAWVRALAYAPDLLG